MGEGERKALTDGTSWDLLGLAKQGGPYRSRTWSCRKRTISSSRLTVEPQWFEGFDPDLTISPEDLKSNRWYCMGGIPCSTIFLLCLAVLNGSYSAA